MESVVLQIDHLSKIYGKTKAIDDVSISLYEKHIYGFIGENGAGKTTLMKILTGLTMPTSGSISIFGRQERKSLEAMRRYMGSVIEAPELYPHYTVMQNLELQRVLLGNPDKSVCEKVLHMVDLTDASQKKVKQLSMGMKQRLGIAVALVGNPKLLILDEPINGLDPKNIVSLRKTLLQLNEEKNITILISSHILSELYLLATDYMMIQKGKIVCSLSQEELEKKCRKYIRIRMNDVPLGITVLENELQAYNYKVTDDNVVYLYSHTNAIESVAKALNEHHILITEITLSEQTLEDFYLSVTGGEAV